MRKVQIEKFESDAGDEYDGVRDVLRADVEASLQGMTPDMKEVQASTFFSLCVRDDTFWANVETERARLNADFVIITRP